MASIWKKISVWALRRKLLLLIIFGVAVVLASLAMLANMWQETYLVLPEPEVRAPVVESETPEPPPAVAAGLDKYDILLLGLDKREDEPELGARTDTILLVTIDPEEKYARVLSIPRDTRVRYNDRWRKINEVYSSAGAEGSVKAVEDLLDMAIDRYAVVDFHGVIDLVDLVGGVVVDVPTNMYKPLENIDLKKGAEQHLNGYDALAFLRYRDSRLSDMDRSERQKAVLIQLAEKILMPANVFKLPTVAKTALTYMETNISLQEILTLAKYGRTILDNGVENQVLPGINDQYNGGWYYVPFLEELGLPMGEAEKEYREYLKQAQIKKAAEASLEEVQEGAAPAQGDAENTAETSDGDGAAESGEPGAGASGEPDAQGASETGAVGASETPETGAQTEPAAQTEPMAQTGVAAQTEPTAQAGAAT